MDLDDFLFPRSCFECGKNGQYLCVACLKKVKTSRQICINCERRSVDGLTHIKCKTPLSLDAPISVWNYEGVIRKALLKLKYKFAKDISKELVTELHRYLISDKVSFPKDLICVPIPLTRQRKNWRGLNQSGEGS